MDGGSVVLFLGVGMVFLSTELELVDLLMDSGLVALSSDVGLVN